MKTYSQDAKDRPGIITLGTFDGIHLGHQKIIKLTVERAKKLNYNSILFTFNPHPLKTISPNNAPKAIASWKQKKEIVQSLGINKLIVEKFTKAFSEIPYQKFVVDYLVNRFKVKEVIVGEDFRCGYQSKGTPERLKKLGEKYGFKVDAIPSIKIDDNEASSSLIRKWVLEGNFTKVKEMLGRHFVIDSVVVSGDKRGRKLGFPTANLELKTNYVLPPAGVYACRAKINKEFYSGAVNLGVLPTFNKNNFSIEVHILDFNEEIYGKRLELEFIEKIRDEEKFANKEELIARIKKDVRQIRSILD